MDLRRCLYVVQGTRLIIVTIMSVGCEDEEDGVNAGVHGV